MIYEFRTYTLKVGSLNPVLDLFEKSMPAREKYSDLGAFFYSEFGRANQILHIWPFEDLNQRAQIRADSHNDPDWPPKIADHLLDMESEVFIPADFVEPLKPGVYGNFYEIRSYDYRPATIPAGLKAWAERIDERVKRSPCVGLFYSDFGRLNKLVHIWPYDSLEQRAEIRAKAEADGIWPPNSGDKRPITQDVAIWRPAAFSPVK
ncbi:MAG: NIPSNAP family protein [Proteobacteria bacterium]|nr:NIPSNAP family protein [Pseudomonadota bacterium]